MLKNASKRPKGAIGISLYVIVSVFMAALLMMILDGSLISTLNIHAHMTAEISVERVNYAILSLNLVETGQIELPLQDMEVKKEDEYVYFKSPNEEYRKELNKELIEADEIYGPNTYTEVDGHLCL